MEINNKICKICNKDKLLSEFPGSGKKDKTKKRALCKICWNNYIIEGYNTKDQYIETRKRYKLNNKNKLKNYSNQYRKDRKKIDNLFKLKCNIRTLISNTFHGHLVSKKSKTYDILGCDFEFFKYYIEGQFTKTMTWGNIHLDHIRPISLAKTEQDIIILNHYTNFQPLLAKDNIKKNNSIIEKQLRLL